MRTVWINPNPPGAQLRKRDVVFCDSKLAPKVPVGTPVPAGTANPVVPDGYVRQIGSDGEVDYLLGDIRSGTLLYDAEIAQFCVPYFTGGWPPDPLSGTVGHTAQRPTGAG